MEKKKTRFLGESHVEKMKETVDIRIMKKKSTIHYSIKVIMPSSDRF